MSHTFAYKDCYIHFSSYDHFTYLSVNNITVQDMNFKLHKGFKSVHAAKCFITRRLRVSK